MSLTQGRQASRKAQTQAAPAHASLKTSLIPAEQVKNLVLAYVDAFNRSDETAMRPLFTDDALIYGVLGWGGYDQVVPIWREIKAAFGIELQVESMIAEDDIVAVRYTERGTSIASFRGGPVTGKSFEVVAMEWFVIKTARFIDAGERAIMLRKCGRWDCLSVRNEFITRQ